MTDEELAAFKAKLVCLLDTSTDEEAQLISDLVDVAAGGGAGYSVTNTVVVEEQTLVADEGGEA